MALTGHLSQPGAQAFRLREHWIIMEDGVERMEETEEGKSAVKCCLPHTHITWPAQGKIKPTQSGSIAENSTAALIKDGEWQKKC